MFPDTDDMNMTSFSSLLSASLVPTPKVPIMGMIISAAAGGGWGGGVIDDLVCEI